MALPLRRLAGLLVIAAAFGCPKAVNAPDAKVAGVGTGIQIGQVVRLDASGSSDPQGRDLSFAWQFTAIPIGSTATLNDAHSATPSFLADVDGEYDVQVVVSNAFVSAAALTVKVPVSKCGGRAPVFGSNAITAKDAARPAITSNFAVGAAVVLASDVSDPDNSTTDQVCTSSQNQALSYAWKLIGQPAASAASLNNTTASSPSFVADVAGTYTVRLVATDSTNRSSVPFDQTFTVSLCGSNAPTISSVAPVTAQLAVGKTIQMTATPDDADNTTNCQAVLGSLQTFRFQWSLPQLPNGSRASLNSAVAQNPSFTPDLDGVYVVRLVVTDSTGLSSAPKDTTITIPRCGNNAPVATITSASGGAAPSAGFIGILLQFGETVQDADGPVNGGPAPSSPACSPTIPQSVTLRWSIVALPAGSTAQLNNPTGTNPSFTPDVAGTYTLQLVATDQSGLFSAPATQSVVVAACGATPPSITKIDTTPASGATTVNAGTSVALAATVSIPDNSCLPGNAQETLTYQWSLVSKPAASNAFIVKPGATGTATDPATFTPDVANGTYQAQLVLTATNGLKSAPGFFSVFTNSCMTNPPKITASTTGADNTSPRVGFDTVTLTAHGSDPDNGSACSPALGSSGSPPQQTLSFQWTLVSRPSGSGAAIAVSTTPADGSVATFQPDVIGPYQFSVVVTDSTGLSSAPSFVTVQTSLCGSHAPVISSANANPTLVGSFTKPRPTLDSVALDALATGGSSDTAINDGDDTCFGGEQSKTFAWTVVSRPAGSSAVITGASGTVTVDATSPFHRHAAAAFVPDVPGAYQFQLDVTDSLGLKAAPAFASITADSCSLAAPLVGPFTADTGEKQFTGFTFPAPSVTNNNCLLTAAGTPNFAWSIVSAPAGSSATLSNPAIATPSFTPDKVGSYQFALTVTNGAGIAAAPVFFNVTAATCALALPNSSLGWSSIGVTRIFDPDPTPAGTTTTGAPYIASPSPSTGAQVTVSAVASDPNGACGTHVQPISYLWAIVAAPNGSHATLTSATDPTPAFVPDVPNGTYQLSVVATDALGNTSAAPNFITVTSTGCGAGVPSVAVSPAGPLTGGNSIFSMVPQAVSLPTPTNPDNNCTARFHIASTAYTYAWSIASQPTNGHGTLTSATGASTNFVAFVPGLYSVHVVATAPNGITSDPNQATSFLAINAKSCGSNAPVVASVSTFAHLTSNVLSRPAVGQQVDLVANATDADAAAACSVPGAGVTGYTWSAISLPSGSVAPSSFTAATGIFTLTPDVAGTFTYSVVATDDTGLQSAPVAVSISTAACGPTFDGIRAADTGGFLTPDSSNTVSGIRGSPLTFDLPPSVAHTGNGTGAVAVSGNPTGAFPVVVRIFASGAVGTSTFQLSVDAGTTFAGAVATSASVAAGATGTTLAFSGTFTATDTYSYATRTGGFLPNDSCVRAPTYAYAWSLSRPGNSQSTLSTLSGVTPAFTPDVVGIYAVQLVISDNAGLVSAPATLTVNATNCGGATPSVGALVATPSSPNAGQSVQLMAPNIRDANTCGSVPVTPPIYSWSLISVPAGSSAKLSSQTAASPTFVADLPNGVWQVALTVTDQIGMVSSPAFLAITSSTCGAVPPTVAFVAGSTTLPDFTATQNLSVNGGVALHLVHGSDPARNLASGAGTTLVPLYPAVPVQLAATVNPGLDSCLTSKTITYRWSIGAQPPGSTASINNPAAVSPSFTPDLPGVYDFQLVLTDQNGRSSTNLLAIDNRAVQPDPKTNHPGNVGTCGTASPIAVAKVSGPIPPPASGTANEPVAIRTQLDATGSAAADSPGVATSDYPAGCGLRPTLSYNWSLVLAPSGSTAQVSSPSLIDASFMPDLPGIYSLDVAVNDGLHTSHAQVSVNAVAGFTTSPAVTGQVFTAMALDNSGNPIVAYWDNANGVVDTLHCTANCNSSSPSWTRYVATPIVTGLTPMTFAAEDAPQPISVVQIGTQVFVAFYTGNGTNPVGTTVPAGGVTPCGASMAIFDNNGGTAWAIHALDNGTVTCNAAGTNAFGRWLAITSTPTSHPITSISRQQTIAPLRSINVQECTNPAGNCTTVSQQVFTALSSEGRWHSINVDSNGSVNLAAYVDDDGAGKHGVQYISANGSLIGTATTTNIGFSTNDTGRFVTMATTGTAVAQAANEFGTTTNNFTITGFALGWRFSVSTPTRVSSLGAYAPGVPLNDSHLVTIWDDATLTPVVSATVPAGTAAPLIGHFRYVPVQPVVLSPGTYTIGEQYSSSIFDPYTFSTSGLVQAPGITWLGSRFVSGSGYPGVTDNIPTNGYYGPTFQVTPAAQAPLIRAIAFRDSTSSVVRYAACQIDSTLGCPLASPQLIADPAGSTNYGLGNTMVRDATGSLRLAYFDAANGKARLLTGSTAGHFQLQAEFPSGSPSGLSMVFGGVTFVGYSQTNTGPLGFFSGP